MLSSIVLLVVALTVMAVLAVCVREPLAVRARQAQNFADLVDTMVSAFASYAPFPEGDWRTRTAAEAFVVLCAVAESLGDGVAANYELMPTSAIDVIAQMRTAAARLRQDDAQTAFMDAYRPLLAAADRFEKLGEIQQRLAAVPVVRYCEEMLYASLSATG